MELYTCECGGDAISVDDWSEEYGDCEIGITLWTLKGQFRYRWQAKLKLLWQCLKYGHPYTDLVLLNEEKATELVAAIQAILDKRKK